MDYKELYHHGILGMKWGKRNGPPYPITVSKKRKIKASEDEKKESDNKEQAKPKSMKSMTDSELREAILRLELEKRYRDLSTPEMKERTSRGKVFMMDVLEKSGKTVAIQFTTYLLGKAVNAVTGEDVVKIPNSKKDKEDKKDK